MNIQYAGGTGAVAIHENERCALDSDDFYEFSIRLRMERVTRSISHNLPLKQKWQY